MAAHKVIMAASSDYFAAMFAGNFREGHLDLVPLEGITCEAFKQILCYVYHGELSLRSSLVISVFEAADMMQYDYVKEQCISYMIEHISDTTCLQYLSMAKQYTLKDVQAKAEQFFYKYFKDMCNTEKFLELPFSIVEGLLDSDELCCDEKNVLEATCNWVKANPDTPDSDRDKLVKNLRYGLLSCKDMDVLRCNQDTLGQENAAQLRENMLEFFMDPRNQPLKAGKFSRPRGPICLVTVGGTNVVSDVDRHMNIFPLDAYFEDEVDYPIEACLQTALPGPRTQTLVVTLGNYLFVIGGKCSEGLMLNVEASIHRYDVLQGYWTQLTSMATARYQHAGTILNDFIFVIGGRDSHGEVLASVERYNISKDEWESRRDFSHPACEGAACTLQGKVPAIIISIFIYLFKPLPYP